MGWLLMTLRTSIAVLIPAPRLSAATVPMPPLKGLLPKMVASNRRSRPYDGFSLPPIVTTR
jgi:hypothetical protein